MFNNVPAFIATLDVRIEVEGIGPILIDIAFGSQLYAFVDVASLDLELLPDEGKKILETAVRERKAIDDCAPRKHCHLRHYEHVNHNIAC